MLVLNRDTYNDTIRIDEEIVVKVLEVRSNCVRIGIEAPKDVKVVREELLKRQS